LRTLLFGTHCYSAAVEKLHPAFAAAFLRGDCCRAFQDAMRSGSAQFSAECNVARRVVPSWRYGKSIGGGYVVPQ
jgi:hypothetical protein